MSVSHPRTSTACALILALSAPLGALAQSQPPIDIPEQDLAGAISHLIETTNLGVMVHARALEGKTSQPVTGATSALEALETMLEGSGLRVNRVDETNASVTQELSFSTQNAEEDPFDLGTLVVRGELIDRTAQESQTSAVIISGEEIEARGETDLEQVIARTPGVVSGGSQGDISIRGIQTDGPTGVGGGRTITTTIDDIRLGPSQTVFGSSALSTWDLEQVEILRGPQSTQSGRNALAGAVRLISNDPVFEDQFRFRVALGNNASSVLSFILNTPMIEDRLAFRLAFDQEQTDGSARNITLGTDDALFVEQTTVRASLRVDPTDRLSAVLRYTFIDEKRGAQSFLATDFPPDRVVREDTQSTFDRTIEGLGLNIAYEINDQWTLESRTTLTEYEHEDVFDADASALPISVGVLPGKAEVFEQEVRLVYDGPTARGVLGFFYLDEETQTDTFASFGGAPLARFFGNEQDTKNYAVFGEIEYIFNEQWRVIAGARYDVEEAERRDFNAAGVLTSQSDTEFEAFLPKLGVIYNFNPDTSLGFTYQQGYRAGGSFINVADPANPTSNPFDPEFTDTFELSFRSIGMGGDLIVNANAFYTDWRDQQQRIQASANPNDFIIVNAASSELWGGELDVRYQASANLNVFTSAAYVQTRFNEFLTPAGDNFAGNDFPYAPELTASFGAEYVFNNGIRLSGDINFTDSSFSDPENSTEKKNDSYWLANLQASYEFDNGVQLVGYVKNLFDEDYTLSRFDGTAGTGQTLTAGEERTFGAFLTARF